MLATLLGFIPSLLKTGARVYSEGKQLKAATVARKDELHKIALEGKLESIKRSESVNNDLDRVNGADPIKWANDVSFAMFMAPIPLSFYPPMVPHIEAGFAVLQTMPKEYQYAVAMMLVSVWGYRGLVQPIILALLGAKQRKIQQPVKLS